ncbi:homocysteine-responsive endoplasmic reticulum-resident ubiquitin-like domain member 2 protein isoform X2 [Belonocnema kinseyi]|uniref:homocysteine-responsive endoplasmic reticulum-resident ubiquitin-like domain member 2 protein isoform X2 n=1 Tax=Belonocnema kinseyi TaxID=2817044 RepID=UPI00143D6878|nr:homocysteine-responsive endoplasmic reticulum-resident ubiquitin-like domain member 2 protein isoform X2 [Belonocnema kinseyi]
METAGVRLIIKAPNQQIEDQIISCELGWTIRKLKDYLAEVYPSKPKTKDQKLIYSGQLLKDSVYLKDVLRSYEDTEDQPFTVHLVCATNKMDTEKKPEKSTKEAPESTKASSSPEQNPPDSRRDRLDAAAQETINTQPTAQVYSTHSLYGQLNTQQIAWMQQVYTHYLTQYMQLMAAQGIQVPNSVPYMQTNPNLNNLVNNNANNNNINPNEEVEQPRQVPQDAADLGAGDEAGGLLNRDWLDFFYMLSRIVVLFSIVYFYSSPIRFLIVAFLGFAMYLYQGGFFRVHPVFLPENNNARQDNNNQLAQNEAAGQGVAPQEVQETGMENEGRTNPNEENETARPGALAFTWSFFSSFFASLIPDQPNIL